MSSSSMSAADVASLYQQNFISNCAQVAAAAVLTYEYALTLEQGMRIVRGRRTATFWLFVLNRLVMIGLVVTNVLEMVPWTHNYSCTAIAAFFDVFQLLTYLIWAVLSAVRLYVVSKGNRYLSVLVFLLALVPFAMNMYSAIMVTYISLPVGPDMSVCDPTGKFSPAFDNRALIGSRTCAIAADVLVLLTTWCHSPRPGIAWTRLLSPASRGMFLVLLLRDGALYFIVLLLITVAQILVNYFEALSIGTVFLVPAMSVLVSRFLLDIFQAAEEARPVSDYDSTSSTDESLDTALEFQNMDVERRDTTLGEMFSYPSHFTDSGLG
ncbi:hypothetical protein DAEQUDRAFT_813010 [Daedalea quercina L-15889]|uniref:DUF6533 domain-containing protein n=1 Tax=Daedalea quercina L-15889 TaxID=1314783 RepID=A0A165NM40_9APHY|nr:hypothetical protein DAEQUDRAFT_813010 [Daedalea quercina L-15889]